MDMQCHFIGVCLLCLLCPSILLFLTIFFPYMASTIDQNLVPVHPMETYWASKNYALFEAEEICPFMCMAHNQAVLFKESQLPLIVSSGRPSNDNILNFLKEPTTTILFVLPILLFLVHLPKSLLWTHTTSSRGMSAQRS